MKPNNSTSTLSSTSFLDEVAQHILREEKPSECAVLLPSYRAIGAFKRAYSKHAPLPCRLPQTFTLSGFIASLSKSVVADPMEVLATLYAEEGNFGKEGFDRFLSWAPIALKDFHSIDAQALDPKQVFMNLQMIKDIEDWSFSPDKDLTEDQTAFANQWSRLEPMYRSLHTELGKKGLVTKSLQNRTIVEEGFDISKYSKVYAAGLVALTESEKNFLRVWDKSEKLVTLWDSDPSYIDNPLCEAGHFIRKAEGYFNTSQSKKYSRLSEEQPELKSVECSSVMSQCQYVREQVIEMTEDELNRTVIVVPDATTLPVLLQALPVSKDGYNVTMGMSIRETPVFSYTKLLNKMILKGAGRWNYDDLLSFVSHPISIAAFGGEDFSKDAGKVLHELAGKFVVWASPNDIEEYSDGKLLEALQLQADLRAKEANAFIAAYMQWANEVGSRLQECQDPWVVAGWSKMRGVLGMVSRLQANHALCKDAKEVIALVDRLIAREKIDLVGEPAKGLQIMGLTETRGIDFDNVIVLDCNEGLVPKHEIVDSFIPFDLQSNLGMPGRFEKESAFAYSFYRLLNRSKKMIMLHRSPTSSSDAAEVSRYVTQLENSFRPGGRLLEIEQSKFSMPLPEKRPEIQALKMTAGMRESLEAWVSRGISPSALNKMVACERNFAYRYLFSLSEPKDLKESIEASTLGSIIHGVLENGTREFLNQKLTPENLRSILKRMTELLNAAIEKEYNVSQVQKGENLLIINSAKQTIKKLLEKEIKELEAGADVVITGIENNISAELEAEGMKVKFSGFADRIETVDGVNRVVDYKSGKVEQRQLNLNAVSEDELNDPDNSKALQLLLYCAVLLADAGANEVIEAAIRSGRNASPGVLKLTIGSSKKDKYTSITKKEIDLMLNWLVNRISSLKEQGRELIHDHDSMYCEYCVSLDPKKKPF